MKNKKLKQSGGGIDTLFAVVLIIAAALLVGLIEVPK
jgi:hypothetical protein